MHTRKPRFLVDVDGNATDRGVFDASPAGAHAVARPHDGESNPQETNPVGRPSATSGSGPVSPAKRGRGRSEPILPYAARVLILIVVSFPISIAAGLLYCLVQNWSTEKLGLQILVYPGMGAGALAGIAIFALGALLSLHDDPAHVFVAFLAGLVVVVARWHFAAGPDQTIFDYLVRESHIHGTIFFAKTGEPEYHGHQESSPLLFWVFTLVEAFVTLMSTLNVGRFGSFSDLGG